MPNRLIEAKPDGVDLRKLRGADKAELFTRYVAVAGSGDNSGLIRRLASHGFTQNEAHITVVHETMSGAIRVKHRVLSPSRLARADDESLITFKPHELSLIQTAMGQIVADIADWEESYR